MPDNSPEVLLRKVGLATVLAGATPFNLGNVSATYRGLIRTSDGSDATAIIKDLPPKELANEVIAAAIGLTMGLPIPPPFIGYAARDRLPGLNGPVLEDGARLMYVSADVGHPQIAAICTAETLGSVLARLAEWRDLGRTYGFDALIANVDRHMGNLLFNGDREVWLIDHGWAFTGPKWTRTDLHPADRTVRSRLKEWLTPRLNPAERSRLVDDAMTVTYDLSTVDFSQLAITNYIFSLLSADDTDAIAAFLTARLRYVSRLTADAAEVLM